MVVTDNYSLSGGKSRRDTLNYPTLMEIELIADNHIDNYYELPIQCDQLNQSFRKILLHPF